MDEEIKNIFTNYMAANKPWMEEFLLLELQGALAEIIND